MPIARFELPDGRIGRFEVPDGTTPEQAMQLISSNLSSLIPKEEPAQQVEAPAAPTANLTPAPPAVSTAAPTAGKPWWAPFAESATGEAELGKQLGPKVLGGPFVQDVAAALQNTPTYAKAAAQAVAGGNTPEDLTSQTDWRHDTIAEARNLSKQNAKDPALQEEYILGITRQKIQELPQNAMFSVISMGAGLAAGAAGLVAGPVSAYAAGTAASGLAAYRMDTNGFLRDIREHLDEGSIKATGKPLTDKQWLDYAKQYNSLVQEHGLWEAVPEALGNALGAKLGATIFKEAGKGLLGTLKSFGATALEFGNELGTETITQTGQHNTEVDAGLSDQPKRSFVNPSDIAQSAKEVLPDVLLLSGMMAGGAHIAGKVYDNTNFGRNKQIADAIKENVKSGNFSPDKIRKEAIARLDPNSYNQELIQPAETVDRNKRLPAVIAPPEQPPEDTQQVEPRVEAAPSESQNTQAMLDELTGEAPAKEPKAKPLIERIGLPQGPARPNAKNDEISFDDAILLKKMMVKTVEDGLTTGKNRQQIVDQLVNLTKDGITPHDFSRINDYMTERGVKEPPEVEEPKTPVEKPQEVVTPPEKTKTFPSHLSPEFQAAYENHLKSADAANKAKSMAKVGTATEAQAQPFIDRAEKARADMYEALFKERDNLSPENKETIDLAQRAIDVGQRGFAEGMLSNIIKNRPPTPQDMDFRRTRTAELETQAKPKENVPIKETHNLDTLFENQSLDKKRLDNLGTFDDRTKESIAKTNEYLQKLADAINAKGFRVFEGHASMPQDVKNLKDAFTNLHAGASRILLDTQHVAGKEARKSKKSHGEQNVEIQAAQKKLNKSHIEQNKDIEKARDLLGEIKRKEPKSMFKREDMQGKPAPEPEEIVNAHEQIKYAKQGQNKAKKQSRSLWSALSGSLTESNVSNLPPDGGYHLLKAGKGKQAVDLSTRIANGDLDDFLPYEMRHDHPDFDFKDAEEEIYAKLTEKNYVTYDAEIEIKQLMGSIEDAEDQIREYLTLKEVNELIDQAADEQREADLDARTLESEREDGATGAGKKELALTGQTPEEVRAAERAKEDRLKADKEAEAKAKADEGVEDFTLTGSNRPADIAAAQGQESLFGEKKFFNIVQFEPEFEEEKKRNPSFKRAVTGLNKYRNKGMLTDEEFALKVAEELDADNNRKSNELTPSRKRGILHIKSRMNAEANRGTISKEAVDLAEWFMNQNPSLVDDLGISIKAKELGTGGFYNNMARVMTLMKYGGNEETPVHEILHHTERMMPTDIQNSIRKEWLQQLLKAQKNAKTPEEKIYFAALMNGHFDDNNSLNIVVKDKSGNVDKSVNKFLFDSIGAAEAFTGSRPNSMELAKFLLQNSDLPIENYRFMNPSEFWAVNGSRIVAGDYASVQGSILTKLKNWLGKLAEKIKSLFGFRSDAPIIRALESLSKSDGRFETKDMLGTGEYKSINQIQGQMFPAAPAQQVGSNISGQQGNMFPPGPPSKRNVFGGPAPKNSWELAPETKLGHLINTLDYKIHDKHVDTRQVQAAITKNAGLIDDTFDAYMKEELYHSRTANEIKDFLKKDLSPIIGDLIKDRLSIDDLEQYLHNRHAEERNDAIAQINPRFADVDNEPGSGIGTKAARDYFKNLDPTKAAQLAKIAAKVDDIIKGTQKILVDRGLETQQTIDNWNGAYKHYIPLMRDQEELDFMHNGAGLGKGFQVKGSASKRAYGSTKSVVDILANIAIQRESAVIRSEKARIGRALYGLALKNPNPDFWLPVNPDAVKNKAALYQELIAMGLPISVAQNFIQEPKTPSIDPLTGQVRYTINAGLRSSPNVFPVRINGKDRYIFFNTKDPKAIRMAQAMSNLDAQTLGGLLGTTALITRWIASVNTQYNPVFGVVNFYRDTKGAMLNMTNTPLAGMQKEVLSHVFPAMFAIIQNERASRNNKTVTNPYSVLYDRFRRAGGTTGFREAFAKGNFSGKDTTIIERLWKEETQGAAMKKARYIFDALSDYNEAMENAVRLSIFKVALDHNLSEERAASLGKNITINFNRKGQSTPLFQALYAFFNPAVQGTVLVGKTLAGPAGRKIVAGGLAIGVLQALWMAAAGFDADEPPDYVRDKNFIIPIGNKKYLTLPMPPGYNVIPGLSRIITEYILGQNHLISGGKPLTDAAAQILTLFLDSFNPLGGGSLLQMVSPTVIDPIAATAMNKDAFGRPIFKEDLSTKPTPGFMRSRENATQVSQWIAEFLNYVSSPAGTHYTKGKWSPTADEIDYYAGQVGGGAAREVIKAAELAKSAFTSEPVPSYRIPLAGRFYGDAKSQSAIQDKFYNNITLMNKYGNEITNIQKSGQDPSKYMRAHPEAQLYNAASNFNNAINEMNKNKKNMLKNKLPLKDIREYEAQKYQIMKTFNDQVASTQKQR